ncbi:uncharacterized protein [Mytilus edulis]|uniref:uncharacterized protein n=1 Tax=Mytilus edulis TaxID=6550 RepID=UPI0039EDFD35
MNFFTYDMNNFVLVGLLWNLLTVYSGDVHEKDFCYGKTRPVICNINEKISIRDISYERNCSSCHCTFYTDSTCAEFRLPGSWKNNYYYEGLSGFKQKQIKGERVSCPNNAQIFSNQAHLKYECINDNSAINFCTNFKKTEGPSVHLKYGFSSLLTSKRNCKCKALTTSGTLQIQAVDIRLQNVSSGICDKDQNSYLEFDSINNVIKCQHQQLIGGYETIYNSSNSSIELLLHLDGDRPIVWIAIQATSGRNVSVVCGNIDVDTTLSYGLTSSNSEGINLTTSVNLKETKSTKFTHSKIVNPTIFTNLEMNNRKTASHSEQTSTYHNIQLTDVTQYNKIAESVSRMTEKVDLETSTYAEVINLTTTAPHSEQAINNQNIHPTDVTKYHKIEESVSRMKDEDIDPAIIVLVLTGFLTLVLIIIGIVIGKVKYTNKRLDTIQSDYSKERKTIAKANTYINQELEKSQSPTSQSEDSTSSTIKEDQIFYSKVQKKRRSDQISDNYDHLNNARFSTPEENNYTHNKTGIYDHCRPIVHSSDCNYDKMEVNNSEASPNSQQGNILLYPRIDTPPKQESGENFDEQNINPYVDEAVINGMASAYRLRSLSSTNDVDESIRDMMTHATSWAEEDTL